MNIKSIHELLNGIYDKAEKLNNNLTKLNYKTELSSYNKHIIKIDDKYYEQKYYMPVISILNKGDICFNFERVEFEFYISEDEIDNIDLDALINDYKNVLNIYEFKDSTIDIYQIGDNKFDILNKIKTSKDNKFGISLDVTHLSNEDIINCFNKVLKILNK